MCGFLYLLRANRYDPGYAGQDTTRFSPERVVPGAAAGSLRPNRPVVGQPYLRDVGLTSPREPLTFLAGLALALVDRDSAPLTKRLRAVVWFGPSLVGVGGEIGLRRRIGSDDPVERER